jgi:hypothetical protein
MTVLRSELNATMTEVVAEANRDVKDLNLVDNCPAFAAVFARILMEGLEGTTTRAEQVGVICGLFRDAFQASAAVRAQIHAERLADSRAVARTTRTRGAAPNAERAYMKLHAYGALNVKASSVREIGSLVAEVSVDLLGAMNEFDADVAAAAAAAPAPTPAP